MIGLIITGHGHFATGLTSSVELIAGPQQQYVAVDFDGQGTDKIEADIKQAYETLGAECEGIIVAADLVGGTPFRTACLLAANLPNVRVVGGTNLAMLCEIAVARTFVEDLDGLADTAVNTAKDGVVKFEMPQVDNNEEEPEEGI